jgi:hypothetical protein
MAQKLSEMNPMPAVATLALLVGWHNVESDADFSERILKAREWLIDNDPDTLDAATDEVLESKDSIKILISKITTKEKAIEVINALKLAYNLSGGPGAFILGYQEKLKKAGKS